MANELVRVQLAPIFRNFQQRAEKLQDDVLIAGAKILRREEEASIRLRWYDEGKTLRSLQEEVVRQGGKLIYRLFPTATSEDGAPYSLFGEYGTGRRGARTGRPAPRGWRYGDKPGIAARRYSRIAVGVAIPKINVSAKSLAQNFTR